MKLIGITGKSGSGKTTLSNMVGENENVGVIHIDELEDTISGKLKDNNRKSSQIKLKRIRKILNGNKYVFLSYIKLKGILLKRKIEIDSELKLDEDKEKQIVVDEYEVETEEENNNEEYYEEEEEETFDEY